MNNESVTDNSWGAQSFGQRVVAHFRDGRLVKGLTRDFYQGKRRLHVFEESTAHRPAEAVLVDDLKALFFVKDLDGRSDRHDEYSFGKAPGYGRKAVMLFKDREVVAGFTLAHDAGRQGFFIVPADASSNNRRIYVVNSAVTTIQFV